MGLKILHTADWHLDSAFGSFPEAQRAFLRREQRKLPEKIAEICRREMCDLMLLAGDVFDGEPCRDTVDELKRALAECGVPVFISPGNHDWCGMDSVWKREKWPENVYIFTGNVEGVCVPGLDCKVWGAGYQSMDCPALLENFRAEQTESYAIGLFHADPVTKNSPYCPITARQIRQAGFHYLALGHIHKAGMLRLDGNICAWPGCPMGRGWDETGEKGVCIVTVEKDTDVRFLPMDTPRFYDLEWDGKASEAVEALLPPAGSEDFYRITLTGIGDHEMVSGVDAYPNLTVRDRREKLADVWEMAGEDSFRGVYFGKLQALAGEDPRAVLAAEISQRILMGKEVGLP